MKYTLALKYLRNGLLLGCLLVCLGLIVVFSTYLYLLPSVPSIERLGDIRLQTPLRVYSANDELIGEFGEIRRIPVAMEDIPPLYIDALLSTEDKEFYSHNGVSIKGLGRAVVHLALTGKKKYGGSTITMQVARNYFLHKKKKFKRKFIEIILALRIEKAFSKNEILEMYANVIFLGNRSNGIQAASRVYYGKNLNELNLPQIAMIAGLPHAPSSKNPLANPAKALQRRNLVLLRMYEDEKIDEATYFAAIKAPITARYHGRNLKSSAPHIAEMARQEAVRQFGESALTEGYKIYTTIDTKLQGRAQSAVVEGLLNYDLRHGYRGPEASILESNKDIVVTETGQVIGEENLDEWQEVLGDIAVYEGIQPAAVIRVNEGTNNADRWVVALLADGTQVKVPWRRGLAQARPYISEELKGRAPERVGDVLSIGDVVRVYSDNSQWALTQLPEVQAALVSLDANDGAVLALVGGFNYYQNKFNRVIQARRQPGSNFKPFIYVNALERGFTAASIINDAPFVQEDKNLESAWRPKNSSHRFRGPTRLRQALSSSVNLVSVRVLKSMGVRETVQGMWRFGFDTEDFPRNLSLALGSHALSPMEVVTGYAVFANGGYKVEPYFIRSITNNRDEKVYSAVPAVVCEACSESDWFSDSNVTESKLGFKAERIVDARTHYILDSMLKDVVSHGTGKRANVLGRKDVAGKTGTTNDSTNAWFSGYAGGVVTTTWVGFDDRSKLGQREFGGSAALPIWVDFMAQALEGKPEIQRPLPRDLVTIRINSNTGLRAQIDDSDAMFEIFKAENVPMTEAQANTRVKSEHGQNLDPYL